MSVVDKAPAALPDPAAQHFDPGGLLALDQGADGRSVCAVVAQLAALQSYIAHGGDIAFGLDPDCHFFNDGVKFTMTTMSVPDGGTTAVLLGLTMVGLCFARRQFSH